MTARMIGKTWWVDFRADHRRYRIKSPENSRAGARAYEVALRQRLARGEHVGNERSVIKQPTFEQFASQWFEEYVVTNNKYSEQCTKRDVLLSFLIPFFGKTRIDQITSHHVEQYKAHTLKTGVSMKTLKNRLTILRKCLVTAYDWLELEGTPPKITWPKCPPPKTNYLSSEECTALLSHADTLDREMILTALRTGMRQGELKGLQWQSIDWPNRIITIRHSRCDRAKELVSPKSNRERYIPMDAEVCATLLQRAQPKGYVFLDTDGRPFDSRRLVKRLKDVCTKASVRPIGWHTLRHTFASQLALKGVPLHAVQTLLGHTTILTTMRYAHVAPSALRSAIDLLGPQGSLGQPVGNEWLATLK